MTWRGFAKRKDCKHLCRYLLGNIDLTQVMPSLLDSVMCVLQVPGLGCFEVSFGKIDHIGSPVACEQTAINHILLLPEYVLPINGQGLVEEEQECNSKL